MNASLPMKELKGRKKKPVQQVAAEIFQTQQKKKRQTESASREGLVFVLLKINLSYNMF